MSSLVRMIIDDPKNFSLLTADMKKQFIKGGTATVNIAAALARKEAVKNVSDEFILRNNFTTRQIQFTKMTEGASSLEEIRSEIGITNKAPWMALQEEGGKRKPAKGKTLAIPSLVPRGGNLASPILPALKVGRILKKNQRVHGQSKRKYHGSAAQFVARAAVAFEYKLYLPLGGNGDNRNLHIVTEFHRGQENRPFKTELVYDFGAAEASIKARPWLGQAVEKIGAQTQSIFASQMKKLGL